MLLAIIAANSANATSYNNPLHNTKNSQQKLLAGNSCLFLHGWHSTQF